MRRRGWIALLGLACQPIAEEDIDLGIVLRPTTLTQVVNGAALDLAVEIQPSSVWSVFGVRTRGCRSDNVVPADPIPWTTGVTGNLPLLCNPTDSGSSCGSRLSDPFCCSRPHLPDADWCELDVVADDWAVDSASDLLPGHAVVNLIVPETGGELDAILDMPHMMLEGDTSLRTTTQVIRRINGTRQAVDVPESLVLELGGERWLSPVSEALGNGETVTIRPGDALHDPLVDQLVGGAGLHIDADNDGYVDDDERGSLGNFTAE